VAESITLDELRRFTVARNFFKPTTLKSALHKMGFVQADPIRAPARAQDLILRHRVNNYKAGDLERRYASLDVEEDFFINYGYVSRWLYSLMHPRSNTLAARDRRILRAWEGDELLGRLVKCDDALDGCDALSWSVACVAA
jgi:uncharacterized protein YcaQ